MQYTIPFALILVLSIPVKASVFQIGPDRQYRSPNTLYQSHVVQEGDTILLDAASYTGTAALAVWKQNNLLIRGNGGKARLIANGKYIWGKGIWVLVGHNITVQHIIFEGAAVPDKNGAGIRLDGIGLTAQYCAFINNENGILTSNPFSGDIVIEYCEFDQGGHGDGYSHNAYIGRVNSLTYRFNYSHHAKIGHLLKSRARYNFILYNRIMDEQSGYSSRLIDLPNGGVSIIMGNVLMQGAHAENSTLIGYGLEGLTTAIPNELYVINNSFVNKRPHSGIFVDVEEETEYSLIANNIFAGGGRVHRGEIADIHHNIVCQTVDSVGFVDEINYDYRLLPNSPTIDYGIRLNPVYGRSLTPEFIYNHPMKKEDRVHFTPVDAGAYEFEKNTNSVQTMARHLNIYPNPAKDRIFINCKKEIHCAFHIWDAKGKIVRQGISKNEIDISMLEKGIYFIYIAGRSGNESVRKFMIL